MAWNVILIFRTRFFLGPQLEDIDISSTLLMLIRLKVLRGAGGIGRKNMSEYTPEEAKYILYYSLWLFIPLVAGATMMSYEHFWGG